MVAATTIPALLAKMWATSSLTGTPQESWPLLVAHPRSHLDDWLVVFSACIASDAKSGVTHQDDADAGM